MFTLIAENKYGQKLELTHNDAYVITGIDGISPSDAVINSTRNASADGSVYNSSYVDNRTITITLSVNSPAEDNRINLYKYFKAKYPVRLYYKNAHRNVYIDGYVESMPIGYFEKKEVVQIVIFCPNPYFNNVEDSVTEFANTINLFEFPFAIEAEGIPFSEMAVNVETNVINNGDIETGVIIQILAIGSVTNPSFYNMRTGEFFIIDMELEQGDVVMINTRKKEKSVKLTHEGITSNIVGKIRFGSTWLQLVPDDNIFVATADLLPENMLCEFYLVDQYEGV